jgi:hypothetical protein
MYPLFWADSLAWYRWPIEIDGLPIKKWWLSMAMLNNQVVYIYIYNLLQSQLRQDYFAISKLLPEVPLFVPLILFDT